MNLQGHTQTLVARQDGNANRLVHGLYARRRSDLPAAAKDVADQLLALPHVSEADTLGAIEIGNLVALIDNVDRALANGRVENRSGQARALLDHRRRLSDQLGKWLDRYGLTPKGRADWVRSLAAGTLADEIRRRRDETS